jgi:hypothetical protein
LLSADLTSVNISAISTSYWENEEDIGSDAKGQWVIQANTKVIHQSTHQSNTKWYPNIDAKS